MKHKKIVFSIYDDLNNPFYAGGGARVIKELSTRLSKIYDVTVVCGKYKNCQNKIVDGVKYEYIGAENLGPWFSQLFFHFFLWLKILKTEHDLWIETFTPPFSTSFLPLFTKKPVIGYVQMLSGEDMFRKYKLPFQLIERIGLRFYRNFIVLTDFSKQKILNYCRQANIVVIPNGVDVKNQQEIKKGNYILYLGRVELNQKGIDLLLGAYSQTRAKDKFDLVIAGNGSDEDIEKIKDMIRMKDLADNVKLIGRVEGNEKEKLLAEAYCVVVSSRFDTFNLVVLEAFNYGKPVIYFNIETLSWIPENASIAVNPFNITEYANKIDLLISNPEEYHQLSLNARKNALKFGWQEIADRHIHFYETLL